MPINSKEKGKRGERDWAAYLVSKGYEARRGQQYNGIEGEDVIGLPGIHQEVKRVEKLNLDKAMDQSIEDAAESKIPVLVHKKNRRPWFITLRADDFLELYDAWMHIPKKGDGSDNSISRKARNSRSEKRQTGPY